MEVRRPLVLLIGICVLMSLACDRSSPSSSDLTKALFTLSDLPDGPWELEPPDTPSTPQPARTSTPTSATGSQQIITSNTVTFYRVPTIREAEVNFRYRDAAMPRLEHLVATYTPENAALLMQGQRDVVPTAQAFAAGVPGWKDRTTVLPLPALGDETAAWRMAGEQDGRASDLITIVIRRKTTLCFLTFYDERPTGADLDLGMVERLARTADAKLAKVVK
jgi:hypothetical protein